MKNLILTILAGVITLSFCQPLKAQDGVFTDARTLTDKRFSLGFQGAVYPALNNDSMFYLRGGYGLQPNLSFYGKLGILRNQTYVGGHLTYQLSREPFDAVSVALIGGAFAINDVGLKLGATASRDMGVFNLYTGLLYEPIFRSRTNPLLVPLGMSIPLSKVASFVFEVDFALNRYADNYQALHTGLTIYF